MPKCLIDINGQPFLSLLFQQLLRSGITSAVLATGHLGQAVYETYQHLYRGLRISYSQEPVPLGTGGALRSAWGDWDTALVLNGDSFCDMDLSPLVDVGSHRPDLMCVVHMEDLKRFGQVTLAQGNRISGFAEKPLLPDAGLSAGGFINAGIYSLSNTLVASIPSGHRVSLERDIFPRHLNGTLRAWPTTTRFIDIGTPESLAVADTFFRATVEHRPKVVFMELRGTILEERERFGTGSRSELQAQAVEAITSLKRLGCRVVVVDVRAGTGDHACERDASAKTTRWLLPQFDSWGTAVDGVYCCIYQPGLKTDRRTKLGKLLRDAARAHGASLTRSAVLSTNISTIATAETTGCATFMIQGDSDGRSEHIQHDCSERVAKDLLAATLQCRTWIANIGD